MNEKNLIPFDQRSESEVRDLARKGGINSGKTRRKKRSLREICEIYGQLGSDSPLVDVLEEDERTKDAAVVAAQYQAAELGDTKAATWVRDTKGESQLNINASEEHKIVFVDE